MELSMDDIRSVTDPYQAFVDSIKNSETLRKYDRNLYHFLKLVPNSLYRDTLEKIPYDDKKETLSKFYT